MCQEERPGRSPLRTNCSLALQLCWATADYYFIMTTTDYIEDPTLLIVFVRGRKVMLSPHLAVLYEVQSKALLQAVRRNMLRFPEDFMFEITPDELEDLRSQNVTLNASGRGKHSKYPLYAFTQEGIAMLSSVLRSQRAIEVNIAIMRAFVKLRELMNSHKELSRKIEAIERRYDSQFKVVFNSIKELINANPKELPLKLVKKKIGFGRD